MTFQRVQILGWALFEVLTSPQMNQLDIDHTNALDGAGGGVYVPTATIQLELPDDSGVGSPLTVFGAKSTTSTGTYGLRAGGGAGVTPGSGVLGQGAVNGAVADPLVQGVGVIGQGTTGNGSAGIVGGYGVVGKGGTSTVTNSTGGVGVHGAGADHSAVTGGTGGYGVQGTGGPGVDSTHGGAGGRFVGGVGSLAPGVIAVGGSGGGCGLQANATAVDGSGVIAFGKGGGCGVAATGDVTASAVVQADGVRAFGFGGGHGVAGLGGTGLNAVTGVPYGVVGFAGIAGGGGVFGLCHDGPGDAAGVTGKGASSIGAAGGYGGWFTGSATHASLRLEPHNPGVDPVALNDGDVWTDGTSIFVRLGGLTKTFTVT